MAFEIANVPDSASGRLTLSVDTATVGGVALDTLGGVLIADDASHARFSFGAQSRNGPLVVAGGTWSLLKNAWDVGLTSLDLVVGRDEWTLAGPAHLQRDSLGSRLDSLVVKNRDTAVVAFGGDIPLAGAVSGRLRATNLPLDDIGVLEQLTDSISGLGDVNATLTGTRDHPVLATETVVRGLKRNGVTVDRMTLNAELRDRLADANLSVVRAGATALTASAKIPIDFKLFSIKSRSDSLSGQIDVPTTDLSIVQLASPAFSQVTGSIEGQITVAGTAAAPVLNTGAKGVQIRNGGANLTQLGVQLRDVNCKVSGAGSLAGGDSISISPCRATSVGAKNAPTGSIGVDGWTKNLARFFLTKADAAKPAPVPSFRVAIALQQFHAYDKRSIADVYVTTVRSADLRSTDSIRVVGDLNSPTLTGAIVVDRGAIFIADRDLARKQSLDYLPDFNTQTSVVAGRAGLPTFMRNLNQNLTVTLGNDVRLKSKEADVRLAGSLNVVKSTERSTRFLASTNELIPKPGLEGTLSTVGGTYTLDLGLAQREFDVLPGGTVTFTGDAQNPTLDISAQYNVKQYHDRDLGVIVNLRGPLLPYPQIDFSSNADYAISESDLVSYLVTGAPGFELNPSNKEVLAQFIGPTVSALTANSLRQLVGPWVDAFRFELGTGTGQPSGTQSNNVNYTQYLYGATVGVEKQFANKMFLSVNTGLCQLDPNFQSSNPLAGIGAKVEYRPKPAFSTQVAYDPATASRTCSPGQSIIGLVPTPGQFSFSFHHTFRF